VPGVESVNVHMVWSPPWRPAMMSDEAKDLLGWL
jgi:metal-sulfur cluster biosynthetic enzyme